MSDILLSLAVTIVAVMATLLGRRLGKTEDKSWLLVVIIPLMVLVATAFALNFRWLAFIAPTSWLASGSGRWICLTLASAMTLGALSARVRATGQQRALLLLAGAVILRAGTLPFLGPFLSRADLLAMKTQVDPQGVCLQSTSYTCGPAAAVTALRRLGFNAEEGEIGLLCKTDRFSGTADDTLAAKLTQRYGSKGLSIEHRFMSSVDELRSWPVSIAVIRYNFLVDHYVTVLRIESDKIIVGDPLVGEESMPIAEFEKRWRHVAILLRRVTN